MTPMQQIEMLSEDSTATYYFQNYEEYNMWKNLAGK